MTSNNKYRVMYLIIAALALSLVLCAIYLHRSGIQSNNNQGSNSKADITSDGISVKKFKLKIDKEVVDISLVDADVENLSIGIGIASPSSILHNEDNKGFTGLSLKEYADIQNFKVVQSGGFLSSWSPPYPLGYVKIRGKEYNRPHKSWLTTGLFCTNGRSFSIEEFKSTQELNIWLSCIQAGPMIIKDQKIVLNTEKHTWFVTGDKHRQSFICKKRNGHLLMGIAENVALKSLAEIMRKPENEGGLDCINAATLMSKGVSGILVNTTTHKGVFGNADVPLPNAIVIK